MERKEGGRQSSGLAEEMEPEIEIEKEQVGVGGKSGVRVFPKPSGDVSVRKSSAESCLVP